MLLLLGKLSKGGARYIRCAAHTHAQVHTLTHSAPTCTNTEHESAHTLIYSQLVFAFSGPEFILRLRDVTLPLFYLCVVRRLWGGKFTSTVPTRCSYSGSDLRVQILLTGLGEETA